MSAADPSRVDGVLLVSFGGPRAPEDVVPFLQNVTAGRGIPAERLEVVGEHYFARGGVSPINEETEALADALGAALAKRGRPEVKVYVGNRNWDPYVDDAVQRAMADGVRHLAVAVTSAYSGYSSCRQYREDLAGAIERAHEHATKTGLRVPRFSYVRPWGLHPAVLATWQERTAQVAQAALADAGSARAARIVFVAHSLPVGAARSSGPQDAPGAYERELRQVAEVAAHAANERSRRQAAAAAGEPERTATSHTDETGADHVRGDHAGEGLARGNDAGENAALGDTAGAPDASGETAGRDVAPPDVAWELVWCSRSGRPEHPWLEPDVSDALEEMSADGVTAVGVVPIGFVADHMEVVQDLDTDAAATAARLGMAFHRAETLRAEPAVADALAGLALAAGASPGVCPAGCCPAPSRPGASTASAKPAAFEAASND